MCVHFFSLQNNFLKNHKGVNVFILTRAHTHVDRVILENIKFGFVAAVYELFLSPLISKIVPVQFHALKYNVLTGDLECVCVPS